MRSRIFFNVTLAGGIFTFAGHALGYGRVGDPCGSNNVQLSCKTMYLRANGDPNYHVPVVATGPAAVGTFQWQSTGDPDSESCDASIRMYDAALEQYFVASTSDGLSIDGYTVKVTYTTIPATEGPDGQRSETRVPETTIANRLRATLLPHSAKSADGATSAGVTSINPIGWSAEDPRHVHTASYSCELILP